MSLLDSFLLDPLRLDVWIALRTDGVKGSGTESDPYDASPKQESSVSVSSLTSAVREATATTNGAHGYSNGDVVKIMGATGTGADQYNGRFSIYSTTSTTFKYAMVSVPAASTASGSITCARVTFPIDQLLYEVALEYITVRLGPGLFETRGFSQRWGGRYARSGQKIIGSGIDVTTLKIVHGFGAEEGSAGDPIGLLAIGTTIDSNIVDFEASDFTVDCNLDGQPTPKAKASATKAFPQVICGAIRVGGSRSRVRRVRAINWGGGLYDGPAPECFVLSLGFPATTGTESVDCVIEDCILEHPSENSANLVTCINIGGGSSGAVQVYHRACVIRNCVVNCRYVRDGANVSSHPVAIKNITLVSGRQYTLETWTPHYRTLNNNVNVSFVKVIPTPGAQPITSAVFNGSFVIDQIVSETELKYTILADPDGSLPAGILASVGAGFHGLGATGGTGGLVEGNRVYGTQVGCYGDTGSSKDVIVRNNFFSDVVCGVCQSMGLTSGTTPAVSITSSGTVATLTTPSAHGLLPGSAVLVTLARVNNNPNNPYNGFFEVLDVTTTPTNTLTYEMSSSPGQPADSGSGEYVEYWRIRNFVVENNVIELALSAPPLPPSFGIFLADYIALTSLEIYLQSVIRGNVIHELDDVPDASSFGIALVKCKNAVTEQNVIDPAVGTAIVQNLSGALEYFDNATPAGVLLQGYDQQQNRKVDELTSMVEDSLLFSI